MEAVLWIVLGVALAIAEAFTATLLIIFFAVGALAAAGAAALGAPLLLQVIVFAIVSGLSVGALRPIILRHARPAAGDRRHAVRHWRRSRAVTRRSSKRSTPTTA